MDSFEEIFVKGWQVFAQADAMFRVAIFAGITSFLILWIDAGSELLEICGSKEVWF